MQWRPLGKIPTFLSRQMRAGKELAPARRALESKTAILTYKFWYGSRLSTDRLGTGRIGIRERASKSAKGWPATVEASCKTSVFLLEAEASGERSCHYEKGFWIRRSHVYLQISYELNRSLQSALPTKPLGSILRAKTTKSSVTRLDSLPLRRGAKSKGIGRTPCLAKPPLPKSGRSINYLGIHIH